MQYNKNVLIIFYSISKECDYVNGKIICPDLRHLGETVLRQSQLATIRMLYILDKVCRKHGIKYWVQRGTLIGAVRHNGSIPWDLDIDIGILSEDHEKLRLVSHEMPSDVFLQNYSSDSAFSNKLKVSVGKLRDHHSCFGYCARTGCKHHDGLMVDMFGFEIKNDVLVPLRVNQGSLQSKKDDVFPLTELKYEGFSVFAPRNFKTVLEERYGKHYMEVPSKRNRCPFGGMVGMPWHSCKSLTEMVFPQGRDIAYNFLITKSKYLAQYLS